MRIVTATSEPPAPPHPPLGPHRSPGPRALGVLAPAGPGPAMPAAAPSLVFPRGYVPGRSAAMLKLTGQIQSLVHGDAPVLLLGETGVGKELIAHALHASSRRVAGPFVAVNCAAIPAELMEAEMFGVARGAATGVAERPGQFQQARGGTLLLDEIGEMPLALQAKLLRALQGREIQPVGGRPVRLDTRVLAATNSDVERKMEQGRFRPDLYYRLAAFVVRVPPLRERREDIPGLVQAFLRAFADEAGKSVPGIAAGASRALSAYAWPGNVRELEHEIRRLVFACADGQAIDCAMLSDRVFEAAEPAQAALPASLRLAANVAQLERRLIRAALARSGGRRAPAARLLGISRNGLANKIARLGLLQATSADPAS